MRDLSEEAVRKSAGQAMYTGFAIFEGATWKSGQNAKALKTIEDHAVQLMADVKCAGAASVADECASLVNAAKYEASAAVAVELARVMEELAEAKAGQTKALEDAGGADSKIGHIKHQVERMRTAMMGMEAALEKVNTNMRMLAGCTLADIITERAGADACREYATAQMKMRAVMAEGAVA